MEKTRNELKDAILAAGRIALIMHISPDGDTCGSALALCRGFILAGKRAFVVCDDPVPAIYRGLVGAGDVRTPDAIGGEAVDLAIAVDVADRARLGKCVALFDAAGDTAQIDHHETNTRFARLNMLRSPLSATGVLACEMLDALNVLLDRQIAECLYVAVATDTGSFKQENTDEQALRIAARCVGTGFALHDAARRVFDLRPLCQGKLLGRALDSLMLECGGRLSLMVLTKRDFADCGALYEHSEGLVNFAMNTQGAEAACLLVEKEGAVKCSLRAMPPTDVAKVAASFGGGGHALAAGCTLPLPLEAARETMLAALSEALAL